MGLGNLRLYNIELSGFNKSIVGNEKISTAKNIEI